MIKHIKRVPVKNPKPSATGPKHQLPDYTNYRIPNVGGDDAPAGQDAIKIANVLGGMPSQPMPVHQPVPPPVALGAIGGAPDSNQGNSLMPSQPFDYLSALGQVPPSFGNTAQNSATMPMQMGNQALQQMAQSQGQMSQGQNLSNYPPFMLTNFQQPGVPSMNMNGMNMNMNGMNGLPNFPPVNQANNNDDNDNNNAPAPGAIGDMTQQLLASQRTTNDLNAALLQMLVDQQRRRDTNPMSNAPAGTPNNGANLTDDMLSALARSKNLFTPQAQGQSSPSQN